MLAIWLIATLIGNSEATLAQRSSEATPMFCFQNVASGRQILDSASTNFEPASDFRLDPLIDPFTGKLKSHILKSSSLILIPEILDPFSGSSKPTAQLDNRICLSPDTLQALASPQASQAQKPHFPALLIAPELLDPFATVLSQ